METDNKKKTSKEAEEKLKAIIDNLNDVVFQLSPSGIIKYVSPNVKNLYGYTPEELIGKHFKKTTPASEVPKALKSLKSVLSGNMVKNFEINQLDSKGNIIPIEISGSPVKKDGKIVAVQGVMRDISDRKKAFKKIRQLSSKIEETNINLKSILDKMAGIAIQGYNENGEIVYWNRHSTKLYGFAEQEVKGKALKGFFLSESDEKEFIKHIKNAIVNRKSSPKKELGIISKTGDVKHVICHIFPAALAEQQHIAIAMNIDITESKSTKEKINEIFRQLERFSEISADILSTEDEEELFNRISQAVVDISDFERVLISFFTDKPPFREIIGHRGVKRADLNRVKKVKMSREKYLKYFEKGKKVGNQSCYIPHTMKGMLEKNALIPGEKTFPTQKGHWRREDNLLVAMKDSKGKIIGMISVDDSKSGIVPTKETVRPLEIFANLISEIIQRYKLAKKIHESEEKYRELVNNIKIGIFRATPRGKILEANPSCVEMFGYKDAASFLKVNKADLYENPADNQEFMKELDETGIVRNKEVTLQRKDRKTFWASITSAAVWNSSREIAYYDTVIEDITERKKLEEEVHRLSITDELTGLFNRRYLNQNLPDEIRTAERWRSAISFIMIDIDDFKEYNDSFLHLEGDVVLKEAAQVISHVIRREMDWASRFGGDEFAVILPGINAKEAAVVADRIRRIVQSIKFRPKSTIVHKTLSLGVAHCYYTETKLTKEPQIKGNPTNYEKVATELTILADKALFKAKNTGRNKVVISEESIELSRMLR